jgi:prepilin-type N-terminal cleavage/methylation domain-containing protein
MKRNSKRASRATEAGFSLPELMIVILIIMVVSAIAVPTLLNTIADVRLRSSASTMQGILQQLRMQAVRDNTPYTLRSVVAGGTTLLYVDTDGDSAQDSNEPAVGFARDVALAASGNPSATSMGFGSALSGYTTSGTPLAVSFNARGLPCTGSAACNTTKGYVYYLSQQRTTTVTAWAAVTITPAGRIKVWTWSGSAWQ